MRRARPANPQTVYFWAQCDNRNRLSAFIDRRDANEHLVRGWDAGRGI